MLYNYFMFDCFAILSLVSPRQESPKVVIYATFKFRINKQTLVTRGILFNIQFFTRA